MDQCRCSHSNTDTEPTEHTDPLTPISPRKAAPQCSEYLTEYQVTMFHESISQKFTSTISFKIEMQSVKLNNARSTSEREGESLSTVCEISLMD